MGQVKSGQTKSGQVKSGQVKFDRSIQYRAEHLLLMVNSLLGMSLSLATDWDKTHGLVGTFGFAISWSASGIVASVGSLTKLFILVSVSFCRRNVS